MSVDGAGRDRLGRRRVLLGLLGASALPVLSACGGGYEPLPDPMRPGSRLDRLMSTVDPYLDITNAHTDERVALRFADDGRYDARALQRLHWIFRDWREGSSPEIDRRVYWGLAAISDAARKDGHSGQITLLSGFRTKRTNNMLRARGSGASSNSYHLRRRAADIRVAGVESGEVAEYAEWLQIGGVGRYPGSGFTHVDSGPIRTWNG
jgi:uncharacterized protein YcbK (DUF882 family)